MIGGVVMVASVLWCSQAQEAMGDCRISIERERNDLAAGRKFFNTEDVRGARSGTETCLVRFARSADFFLRGPPWLSIFLRVKSLRFEPHAPVRPVAPGRRFGRVRSGSMATPFRLIIV